MGTAGTPSLPVSRPRCAAGRGGLPGDERGSHQAGRRGLAPWLLHLRLHGRSGQGLRAAGGAAAAAAAQAVPGEAVSPPDVAPGHEELPPPPLNTGVRRRGSASRGWMCPPGVCCPRWDAAGDPDVTLAGGVCADGGLRGQEPPRVPRVRAHRGHQLRAGLPPGQAAGEGGERGRGGGLTQPLCSPGVNPRAQGTSGLLWEP